MSNDRLKEIDSILEELYQASTRLNNAGDTVTKQKIQALIGELLLERVRLRMIQGEQK